MGDDEGGVVPQPEAEAPAARPEPEGLVAHDPPPLLRRLDGFSVTLLSLLDEDGKLSKEEVLKRTAELRKMRDLLFYHETKANAAASKWPSWRRHGWPPRAHQTASEGLGLPSARVRRAPAPPIPPGGHDLPARGRPS